MAAHQDTPENLPRPGMIGRAARIFLGVVLLFFFAQLLPQASGFIAAQKGWSIPRGDWWVWAILCFLAFSTVVNSGFGRQWGLWPQAVYLTLAAAAAGWDRIVYRALWAPPLGILVLLLILYILGHPGISFLIAGAAATPG